MGIFSFYKMKVTKQFIKFCLVGAENTTITYLSFIILFYYLNINYFISTVIAFVLGTSFGFIFNKAYTFNSNKSSAITMPQYFLIYSISLSFGLLLVRLLVDYFGIFPLLAILLVNPFIVLVNFLGTKILVFKNKDWR